MSEKSRRFPRLGEQQLNVFIATTWNAGAVAQQFIGLAQEMAARGHQATLIVPASNRVAEDLHGNPRIIKWISPRPTTAGDARLLFGLIRDSRPDCIISNFGAVNVCTLVGAALRVPRRLVWYHTLFEQTSLDFDGHALKLRALQVRKALVYRAATDIVANSAAAKADVQRHFKVSPSKCTVFLNSIPDPLPLTRMAQREPHKIVCIGRLHRSKGQETLVRALSVLENASATVTFVGDGPTRPLLERLAEDLGVLHRCRFLGSVGGETVREELLTATVSVVPSIAEAFGLVNLESLALGAPLVVSETGGIVEVVRNGIEALFFPPGDSDALARQIDRLLTDRELASRIATAGRARFEDKFEQRRAVVALANWISSFA